MRKNIDFFLLIVCSYVILLFIRKPGIFTYKFSHSLVDRYLCSQDIPYEPPCHRLFVSDGDIYAATGYLYTHGADPTTYNFQMPPLIKYLFGYSIALLGNPYYVQVLLGIMLLILTYALGQKVYKSSTIPLLACLFLVIDPVLFEVTTNLLLDLGQTVLLLLYIYLLFFQEKKYYLHGAVLGLLFATKFWAGSLFFMILLTVYKIFKKQFRAKKFLLQILSAFIVFCLMYTKTFMHQGLHFNIFFFELKTLKFMLAHDVHSFPFASFILFLTGFHQIWWNNKAVIHSSVWSILWPLGLMVSFYNMRRTWIKKNLNLKNFFAIIPLIYIIYLGVQAPFTRYFMLILPFLYLILAEWVVKSFIPVMIKTIASHK